MEKKMIKQMMMALLLAMMPLQQAHRNFQQKVHGLMNQQNWVKTKHQTQVLYRIHNYRIIDHSIGDMREYYAILEIGDTVSKFESYGSYRLDSVLVGKQQMTNGEFFKTYNMYRPDFKEFLLENANTKRLSYYGKVSIDSYTYQEDIPQN